MKLYDWQVPLAEKTALALQERRVAILSAQTGAGKTPIAIDVARRLGMHYLVIAPKVSLTQWKRTAEAMGYSDSLLGIINPERLSIAQGCAFYNRGWDSPWKIPENTLVIWDEPHRNASGIDSRATLAMAQLKAYPTSRLLAMSATIADSPLKLRGIGYWLALHDFTKHSFYDWCRMHECQDVPMGWGATRRSVFMFTRNPFQARNAMQSIHQEIGSALITCTASEIPGFPDETIETISLDLDKDNQKAIKEAYASMCPRLLSKAASDMAEVLKQRQRAEYCKVKATVELAEGYEEDGYSPVLFFNFTESRLLAEKILTEHSKQFASIFGGQTDVSRQKGIDSFMDNSIHFLICMSQAASCALSAHDVHHVRPRVSFISPGFNAADMKQALGRIRRVNGTKATPFFVLAANTVEDRVARSLERKLSNIDTINDSDLLPIASK